MLKVIFLVYYRFNDVMFAEAAMGGAVPVADMDGGSAAAQTSQAVRKYFPETWIWECTNLGFVFGPIFSVFCVLAWYRLPFYIDVTKPIFQL